MIDTLKKRWDEGEKYMESKEYLDGSAEYKRHIELEMQNILNKIKYTARGWA